MSQRAVCQVRTCGWFVEHIKPLFRASDREAMKWAFDLANHAVVARNAVSMLQRLCAGSMPCDGPWPLAQVGHDYLHAAIDDHSRVAFVRALADENGPACARFLRDAAHYFPSEGVTIERVMTDDARNDTTSTFFKQALVDLGISRKRTRVRRPQTNRKAERFIRTLLDEFATRVSSPRTGGGCMPSASG